MDPLEQDLTAWGMHLDSPADGPRKAILKTFQKLGSKRRCSPVDEDPGAHGRVEMPKALLPASASPWGKV